MSKASMWCRPAKHLLQVLPESTCRDRRPILTALLGRSGTRTCCYKVIGSFAHPKWPRSARMAAQAPATSRSL